MPVALCEGNKIAAAAAQRRGVSLPLPRQTAGPEKGPKEKIALLRLGLRLDESAHGFWKRPGGGSATGSAKKNYKSMKNQ